MIWRIALAVLAVASMVYGCAIAWLWWNQRVLLYPAPPQPGMSPVGTGTLVTLATADGFDLRAIYREPRAGQPTLVFFHGNGDSLAGSEAATRALASQGYGLLLPEYRGYGGNAGKPTEAGLYRDGAAALHWLAVRGIAPERVVLIGNSLGSGVATELAATNRVGALVLVSGFTSMVEAAKGQMPFVPVRWLLHDRYENRRKMDRVRCPVLVLHGAADTLVPVRHGRSLAEAAPGATLKIFPGAGHDLAYSVAAQAHIAAWLRRTGF